MIPVLLRFADEAEAIAVLAQFRALDQDGAPFWITASATHALHIPPGGVVQRPTGVLLPSTEPGMPDVPEMEALPGYHVDALFEIVPDHLGPYTVTPANPACQFAGHERPTP